MPVDYPVDERGNVLMFPGAPAPDPARQREVMHQHFVSFVDFDLGYALWAAGDLAKRSPDTHGDALQRLEAHLINKNIRRPAPFIEPECKLPPVKKGVRGLPQQRLWSES